MDMQLPVLDSQIPYERGTLHLSIGCFVDEDVGVIFLPITVQENERIVALAHARATISNPIDVIASLSFAATAFAGCVAIGAVSLTMRLLREEYARSKKETPDMPLQRRLADVVARIRDRTPHIKEETKRTCEDCLALLIVGGADGN